MKFHKADVRIALTTVILMVVLVSIGGCDSGSYATMSTSKTEDFSDCKASMIKVHNEQGTYVGRYMVIRCPNSSTSTSSSGKGSYTTITIDGVEYEAKKKEANTKTGK